MAAEYLKLLNSPIWALFKQACVLEQQRLLNVAIHLTNTNERLRSLDNARGIDMALQVPELFRNELSIECQKVYGHSLEEVEMRAAEYTGTAVKEAAVELEQEEV